MGGKRTLRTCMNTAHLVPMRTFNRLALTIVLISLACGCAKAPQPQELGVCDAIRRAPELLGKPIVMVGWYGSTGFWAAIGSRDCLGTLVEPKLGPNVAIQAPDSGQQAVRVLREALDNRVLPPLDFHGRFHGALEKRTGHGQSGPVPLDAAPTLDQMPYVIVLERVDAVRFERAPFFEVPPPPSR